MASLPTGVTIVATSDEDGPAGATANAVTSLSVEPMLMPACLDRGTRLPIASTFPTATGTPLVFHGGAYRPLR